MSVRNEPKIWAYIGASGSGKGVSINAALRQLKPARLLIWDPRDEYDKHAPRYTSLKALALAVAKAGAGPFRARFVAGDSMKLEAAFAFVCRLAFDAGNLVFLAEELSDVTSASQAPPAWRKCITQGRHQGLHIMAAAQRPALIDKTLLGNCTFVRCFGLRYDDDRRAMAKALDVDQARVNALRTVKDSRGVVIAYLERDFRNADEARAGNIKLKAT
ncbi:hypothetical protein QWZ02_09365 [Kinneretia asaccharophila]|uniref:Helicase HerA central domain-containing protein n=1 Tax=Roseateles asaccharophilus TaxID=582607 RepID=A0A4R6N354_9BURK|nr:hypothetical protein [Roseateles asaccharophilus]MDN3544655.1 hypothetical protein [Roseateles asaccharophilus]TDP09579.1 hypothetical protein DFR39_104140 [Roseateles asaccharophilus]